MKKNIILAAKIFLLQCLFGLLFIKVYAIILGIIDHGLSGWLDIFLVNAAVKIILVSTAFILAIKILNKKNQELIQKNINKLIAIIVFSELILAVIFVFYRLYLNGQLSGFVLVIFVYAVAGSLLDYLFFKTVYSVFIAKRHGKVFAAIVILLFAAYLANFAYYKISFDNNYKKAEIAKDFFVFPQIDIKNIIGQDLRPSGNSAENFVELVNNVDQHEWQKGADKNSLGFVIPDEKDLEALRQISQKEYLSLAERYLPKDIILHRDKSLIVPSNGLRGLSRGMVKIADEQVSKNESQQAKENLGQLLLLGDQMVRDKEDGLVIRLVGISIAKLSADKLSELEPDNADLKKYSAELDEIKNNITVLSQLEVAAVEDNFYHNQNLAKYFKYLDKYGDVVPAAPIINYAFYELKIPNTARGLYTYDFFTEETPSLAENLSGLLSGILEKSNVGRNYIFYQKALELQKIRPSEGIDFYANNDYLSITKKYGDETAEGMEIRNKIFMIK